MSRSRGCGGRSGPASLRFDPRQYRSAETGHVEASEGTVEEVTLVSIALTAEQIRSAPPEVRQWLEREVAAAFGWPVKPDAPDAPPAHLVSCSANDAASILSQIQGVLPAVNVFFEFGRQGAVVPQSRVEAFRLIDIAHNTRLQNVGQVIACLDVITGALRRIKDDSGAAFCGFDREGHCIVPIETQQSIFQLWQTVISGQQLGTAPSEPNVEPAPAMPEQPLSPIERATIS